MAGRNSDARVERWIGEDVRFIVAVGDEVVRDAETSSNRGLALAKGIPGKPDARLPVVHILIRHLVPEPRALTGDDDSVQQRSLRRVGCVRNEIDLTFR